MPDLSTASISAARHELRPGGPAGDGRCISDAALIAGILRSSDFQVVDYARHFGEIANRTGVNFDATLQAMTSMPLANEGEAHRDLRARSARAIAGHATDIATGMRHHIAELVDRTFRRPGEIDLVSQFSFPIFSHLYESWTRLPLDDEPGVSQVFCGRMSLNRRRQVDARLAELDTALDDSVPRIPKDIAMSFAILASDSLVGSISLSLWDAFSRHSGDLISAISFAEALPASAVPYVDRVALRDIEILDESFSAGERVRLMLADAAPSQGEAAGNLFFGAGRHLCVGRSLTETIWKSIVAALTTVDLRATPVEIFMRRPDHVFRYPERATVRLT